MRHRGRFRVVALAFVLPFAAVDLLWQATVPAAFVRAAGTAVAGTAAPYAAIDLGAATEAYALDDAGDVAGVALTTGGATVAPGVSHAVRWSGLRGDRTDLAALTGSRSSVAFGIDDAGIAVGQAEIADYHLHAVSWAGTCPTDLGTLPGGTDSQALAVNALGQVVGQATTGPGLVLLGSGAHAVRWDGGRPTDLGTLPNGTASWATGINAAGQVVGEAALAGGGARAVRWVRGRIADLGTLPGAQVSGAEAINDAGQVVGGGGTAAGGTSYHALLWDRGAIIDLGTLGGQASLALAINDAGVVVGEADVADGTQHAFVWQQGRMADLNDLIPPGGDLVLESARAINASGEIAGIGLRNGHDHAFLLRPRKKADTGATPRAGATPAAPAAIPCAGGQATPVASPAASPAAGPDSSLTALRGTWRQHRRPAGPLAPTPVKNATDTRLRSPDRTRRL
jgi:probable HAF family extracellular repeat protein